MKLAYIVLSHRFPNQVARLIDALKDRGDSFFIHIDKRSESNIHQTLREKFSDDPSVRFVTPRACYWGSFGIVEATLDAIRSLLAAEGNVDRVLLLSGQDYPIKPRRYIKAFLERQDDQEFIESFALTSPNKWTEHSGPYKDLNRILHWHVSFRSRFVHIPIRRSLPGRLKPHGGSQWWCLSRSCIEYLHHFIQDNPRVLEYFRHSFIPDELFFQTLVSNSPFADRVTGSSLTYEDWDAPAPPYPAVMDASYLSILAASHKLFARKFDQTKDMEILDRIDQMLLRPQATARYANARVSTARGAAAASQSHHA